MLKLIYGADLKRCTLAAAIGCVVVASHIAAAQADDWRKAAQDAKLTSAQIEQLARDKILLTDRSCRQAFAPYVEPTVPVFITSDSLLNAYHVLLEESVLQMEQANSQVLPELLEFLWNRLPAVESGIRGNPDLADRAKRQTRIVVGTALDLLKTRRTPAEPKTEEMIRLEVQRVEQSAGQHVPGGFASGDDAYKIDYSRFKPRGFYAQTDTLSRYFRAAGWLQSVPFRVGRDDELLAVLTLGNCIAPEQLPAVAKRRKFTALFECFREFIGQRDDWELTNAAAAAPGTFRVDLSADDLPKIRQTLKAKAKQTGHASAVNDLVVVEPISLSFRVLSAYRTPDAALFQRTTNPQSRTLPTGLEVAVALGSAYAADVLDDPQKDRVLSIIRDSHSLFSGDSLYFDYLRCLATLFDRPAAGAPAFLSGTPWQAKNCTTALAGWAQLRHTWMLQAKQTLVPLSIPGGETPVGFVEPNPAFFGRMKRMAARTADLFDRIETRSDAALQLHWLAELQDLLRFLESRAATGQPLNWDHSPEIYLLSEFLQGTSDRWDLKQPKTFYPKAIARVKESIAAIRQAKPASSVGGNRELHSPIQKLWRQLAEVAARLEVLAKKQLAASPFDHTRFTTEDRDFIVAYGERIAPMLFHTDDIGNVSNPLRDDAPRIADVCSNPSGGECLEVGIGRPRILYVLYPTSKGDVLCLGAMLPYYEFRSRVPLDDAEWKARLDSPNVPALPPWSATLMSESSKGAGGR
jgi:hypothetical protein